MGDWQPSATIGVLRQRARMLAAARTFFAARGVLEVDTPILCAAPVTDPQIDCLSTRVTGIREPLYLAPSAELAMKRLLAAGSGDLYQISRVFRDEEHGRWHNPEFTMIEWYRCGFDDAQLMGDVESMVREVLAPHRHLEPAERMSYAAALHRYGGVDAHADELPKLAAAAAAHGIDCRSVLDRDAALDLLMALVVGPRLGRERPCFICDYPASQASLARLKPGARPVAARFELYVDGLELANGFHELTDAAEQRARFTADRAARRAAGKRETPADERFLAALQSGLPDCAGVALGFDRLVAVALGAERLSAVMAFAIDRA